MRLVLRRQAKGDLREAFHWYEDKQPGLGRRLLASVEASLASIRENPRMYPRVDPSIRRASARPFPFGVFYRIEGDKIRVIAILHNARDPQIWKGRK
jgi:plasmid stabilization system protein ParE